MSPRPQTVSNAEILAAAGRVIGRRGPANLTLADVAQDAGLAPATLVQRFGSKRGLLLAVDEQADADVAEVFRAARHRHEGALAALHAGLASMVEGVDTPETLANHLAFLQIDLSDPEFHGHVLQHARTLHRCISELLEAAIDVRELVPCDTDRLARAVRVTYDGALISWAIYREGALTHWLRADLDFLLAPYQVAC